MQFEAKKEFIFKLLGDDGIRFVIPEYQRAYSWNDNECEALCNDVVSVFGDEEGMKEYFLGSIVAYKNEKSELEIIDGQQRITTFTLLFRAFYEWLKKEGAKEDYINGFGKCIWEYDLDEGLEFSKIRLISKVITDSNNAILRALLQPSIDMESLKKLNSKYAKNFLFFYSKIENMKIDATMQYEKFCKMFLAKRLFILLVVCDSQESAMTIFNTLNSRGKPLSNADILKGYIYKNKKDSQKQEFANKWKELETKIESSNRVKSLDFLFLQYMHIIRAQEPDFDTTTPSVINFFTKKDKKVNYGAHKDWLYKDETIPFLKILIDFWLTPSGYLGNKACRYMRILDIFQNDSWKSFVSCLVWKNRESIEDKERFSQDFDKYLPVLLRNIALLFLNNAGTNDKTKELVFKMNVALIKHDTFESLKYNIPNFENFCEIARQFNAQKAKYLLFLYAYLYSNFSDDIENFELQVEHILPKQWQNANFNGWDKETHAQYLNQIGNKILLPKASNIKCLENFFAKKQEEYKKCENLTEVRDLGERTNHSWLQEDIQNRNREIYQRLKSFIDTNM